MDHWSSQQLRRMQRGGAGENEGIDSESGWFNLENGGIFADYVDVTGPYE